MDTITGLISIPAALTALASMLLIGRWHKAKALSNLVIAGMWANFLLSIMILEPYFTGIGTSSNLSFPPGLSLDGPAALFILLTSLVSATTLSHARLFFRREQELNRELDDGNLITYYLFSLLFHISMVAVFLCDNLGYLWISIEATTLMSAALVYFNRDKHALEAAWKYLIICSVGIAFALFGTVCFYISSKYGAVPGGSLSLNQLIEVAPYLEPTYAKLAFILCFLGYGTKAGLFPLHSWLPDAYSEAPAPASAMISGALLNCALFAIYRIYQVAYALESHNFYQELLLWSGTVTVVAASVFLVRQHGIKRLWGYSSIENAGLMLVAIGLNSTPIFLLHAVNHSIAKVALFLLSGDIIQHAGSKELSQIKGLWTSMPVRSTMLASAAIAVTGAPPFGAFISEWLLLTGCVSMQRWILAVLLILALSLAFIMVAYHTGRILGGGGPRPSEQAGLNGIVPGALLIAALALGIATSPLILEWLK